MCHKRGEGKIINVRAVRGRTWSGCEGVCVGVPVLEAVGALCDEVWSGGGVSRVMDVMLLRSFVEEGVGVEKGEEG